jgi:energy-coupling factor transporter ATP-binding protein EcfA2
LLLDEPHAGLDAEGREVLDRVLAAAPDDGRTVLVASHELDRTRALARREVAVVAGQAVAVLDHDDPRPVPPVIVEVGPR